MTDQDNDSKKGQLNVYYCLCKKLALACSGFELENLQKRKVDNARYVPPDVTYKLSHRPGPTVCLTRSRGKERQHRLLCVNCGLLLAYKPRLDSEDMYIVDGAVLRQDEEANISRGDNQPVVPKRNEIGATSKYGSVSVSTTTEEEEAEIESRELGANYDANASVINMLLNRGGNKRSRVSKEKEEPIKRKKGTLLN